MLVEYVGGSVAGKVIPGPVVCLLLKGGLVVDVGEVTVHVVNLEVVVVAMVVVVVDVDTVVVVGVVVAVILASDAKDAIDF